MTIRPMLSALARRKAGPLLVASQIAIALAICVNGAYFMTLQIASASKPSGLDVPNMFWVTSEGYAQDFNFGASVRADLQLLRSMPGVVTASTINQIPLSGSGSSLVYSTQPDQKGIVQGAIVYTVDEHGLDALGVKLADGRPFDASIVLQPTDKTFFEAMARIPPEAIVTNALAKKLFPNETALGKTIYGYVDRPLKIVGILEDMQGPWPGSSINDLVILHPAVMPGPDAAYLVRTQPGRRDELMRQAEAALSASQTGRVIDRMEAMTDTAGRMKLMAHVTALTVAVVVMGVIAVTALGIFGLAMFNVTSRNKQIGTRRAVGARKLDIMGYFLVENWLITTGGVVVGCALALAIGIALGSALQAPRLPLYYLIGGVLGLWALGLAATFAPARRATAVSPAVATRTV